MEEALRLIETLQVITDEHTTGHAHVGDADAPQASRVGRAPECRVCPVCRLIAAFRQLRPEVMTHLVAAADELLAAAREFAASSTPPGTGSADRRPSEGAASAATDPASPSPASPSAQPTPRRRPSPREPQRIELD